MANNVPVVCSYGRWAVHAEATRGEFVTRERYHVRVNKLTLVEFLFLLFIRVAIWVTE